jgi:hypothetical protein
MVKSVDETQQTKQKKGEEKKGLKYLKIGKT